MPDDVYVAGECIMKQQAVSRQACCSPERCFVFVLILVVMC